MCPGFKNKARIQYQSRVIFLPPTIFGGTMYPVGSHGNASCFWRDNVPRRLAWQCVLFLSGDVPRRLAWQCVLFLSGDVPRRLAWQCVLFLSGDVPRRLAWQCVLFLSGQCTPQARMAMRPVFVGTMYPVGSHGNASCFWRDNVPRRLAWQCVLFLSGQCTP